MDAHGEGGSQSATSEPSAAATTEPSAAQLPSELTPDEHPFDTKLLGFVLTQQSHRLAR